MDWYLVDFLPVEDVVTPIYKSRNLFYIAIGVLLATSFAALALLYRNIQIPIRQLVIGFKEIRDGRFSARVPLAPVQNSSICNGALTRWPRKFNSWSSRCTRKNTL